MFLIHEITLNKPENCSMTTLATALFPRELDSLLDFAARANDAINAGEVRYQDRDDFAAAASALESHMPSLDGITVFAESMRIAATGPAREALNNVLCNGGRTSFDAAIFHVRKALLDTLVMFSTTDIGWRTHPVFKGKEQEWDFLGSDYIALDWMVDQSPFRLRFNDTRDGLPQAPRLCSSGAVARFLVDGGLAFLVPRGDGGVALVCPRVYFKELKTYYDRSIVAATMLLARLGFLSQDSGFCMNPTSATTRRLLELFQLAGAAGLDLPQNLNPSLLAYHLASERPDNAARVTDLRKPCLQALLEYSRPWLHELDSGLASLFRGWAVAVGAGALVDRRAIVCPGATLCNDCTVGPGAIVRNGARVAPHAVVVAGQIVTSSGSIIDVRINDSSSGNVPARTHIGRPPGFIPATRENAMLIQDELPFPFTRGGPPTRSEPDSSRMTGSSGSVSFWHYPVASGLMGDGAETGAQHTTAKPSRSATTSSTTAGNSSTPALPKERLPPIPGQQRDSAPPSCDPRNARPSRRASDANAWPYPEVSRNHTRQFIWIRDPAGMPPQLRTDATQPLVRSWELPTHRLAPEVAQAVLSNEILQYAGVPPPTHAPIPVLYSGRGNSRATPFDNATPAPPPQRLPTPNADHLQANRVGPYPAVSPSMGLQFPFKPM
jgi:hypothetical protein